MKAMLSSAIGKITTLSKATYRFSAVPIKILISFFRELEKISKFRMGPKSPNSQSNSEQK